jgi:hypothetical protein
MNLHPIAWTLVITTAAVFWGGVAITLYRFF